MEEIRYCCHRRNREEDILGLKNTSSRGVVSKGTAEDGDGYSTTGYFPR